MKRVLVCYATMAGSTAETADLVAKELTKPDVMVDVLPLKDVSDLNSYDAVVIGAPMIMGWHREAQSFLKKYRQQLQKIPVAVFILAMSVTQESNIKGIGTIPLMVDEKLPKAPANPGHLSMRERYSTLSNYLRPILSTIQPASIGVFGGRLVYGRLTWWAVLFAMFIVRAQAGDKRNRDAMRSWAQGLSGVFNLEATNLSQALEVEAIS